MPRFTAWRLLRSGSITPLRDVDAQAQDRDLDARDRGLLRRLIGTEVRRRATLRAIVRRFAKGKPSADYAAHLHLAIVQALFLDRIPDHALGSETVRLIGDTCLPADMRNAKGFLHALLLSRTRGHTGNPRRDIVGRACALDRDVFHDPSEHPLLWAEDALSMPAPLMKSWTSRFGIDRARALAVGALEEPELSIRVTAPSPAEIAAELAAVGIVTRPANHPEILLAPADASEAVLASAAMREGRISVQGESALRAARAMDAQAGETILDLCASPGGKTAVLLASGARVSACDVSEEKLARLRATLERLSLTERAELCITNGTSNLPLREFDGVLVDAPCTNTGVLAARPEARWRYGPKTKADLLSLQSRMIREGAERVRQGGRLVWSTCSLDPDENARLVRAFLAEQTQFVLEEELESLPDCAALPASFPL
ncbi:MAG: transcription antitermination factor NusB, partial [Planctomycetota bacterium]